MKMWLGFLVLLIGLFGFADRSWSHDQTLWLTPKHITRVYDGDTLFITLPEQLDVFGKDLGVRVLGINTPEVRSSCTTEELRARERTKAYAARDYLATLLTQARTIELTQLDRDKYFRLLANVTLDGWPVSKLMIDAGYALPYSGGTKESWCGK
jgi:endonuclease YncB( thermonuclease family)